MNNNELITIKVIQEVNATYQHNITWGADEFQELNQKLIDADLLERFDAHNIARALDDGYHPEFTDDALDILYDYLNEFIKEPDKVIDFEESWEVTGVK